MTSTARLPLFVLALALAGCGRQAATPAPLARPAPGFDSIGLARSACYWRCPVYHIEIDKNGNATFTGEEHVKVKGVRALQLRQEDIALLNSAVQRIGFWSLKESYQEEKDGCATLFTDQADLTIQVVSGGKTKTITLYQGCLGPAIPSDGLNWLANTIDYVANTRTLRADPDGEK
jgi:hypothetical protein